MKNYPLERHIPEYPPGFHLSLVSCLPFTLLDVTFLRSLMSNPVFLSISDGVKMGLLEELKNKPAILKRRAEDRNKSRISLYLLLFYLFSSIFPISSKSTFQQFSCPMHLYHSNCVSGATSLSESKFFEISEKLILYPLLKIGRMTILTNVFVGWVQIHLKLS